MNDVTVACSCGRTMSPNVTVGHGAFRCGCGARVTVTVSRPATCIGLAETGERCRMLPIREAAKLGLSLCRQHWEGYLEVLDLIKEGERASGAIELLRRLEDDEFYASDDFRKFRELRERYAGQSVVYYIRIRDLIKIGYTTNMEARMNDLLADEVLATEPGGEPLERMRHAQFKHLKVRGERFRPEAELLSHVAMIREHNGEPNMTGYLRAS